MEKERTLLWSLIAVLVILCGILLLRPLKSVPHFENISPEKENILVQSILPKDIILKRFYIGYVEAINSVQIYPFISGFISDVYVRGGQEVKSGETLFILQQDEYKAQLDLAFAKVAQAKANFDNASSYYDRILQSGDQAISAAKIDEAKADYLSAQASLNAELANANLAQVNYNYTLIKSSIDGIIGNMSITPGDYVSPSSDPLVNVIQYHPIRVVFSISDKEYLKELAKGNPDLFKDWRVRLRLSGGNYYPETSLIEFFNNEINLTTNALSVYADFPNPQKLLTVGAYVEVFLEKNLNKALLVPKNLVYWDKKGSFVYLVNPQNQIEIQGVSIQEAYEQDYIISSGIKENDKIIIQPITPDLIGKVINPIQGDPDARF